MPALRSWCLPALLAIAPLAAPAGDLSGIQQVLSDSETSPAPLGEAPEPNI